MLYTSAEANKLLKQLREEEDALLAIENESKDFIAATVENIEDVRPEYDLSQTMADIEDIRKKIMKVKHAINVFNSTTEVLPGYTIDMVLMLLPMLGERVEAYKRMRQMAPKKRARTMGSGTSAIIDYKYANYDIRDADKAYDKYALMLDDFQLALDKVNTTVQFEIDLF